MKKVTSIVIGAGLRGGHVYSQYALDHPDEFQVVAVAEPDKERRESFAKRHNIPEELCFESYEELLGKEKLADCAMICTMDRMHYEPTIMALKKGYHVLCEKPMSPDKKEIIEMGEMAKKYDRILSVCHVLRYSPFFSKLKELLEEGKIGRLMTIQHMEEVGYWHQAHSFVRGNWRNTELSSPMILQKSCHDMDILVWLSGKSCRRVSSFGSLMHFRPENAPEGAAMRCQDCKAKGKCPYDAEKIYLTDERTGVLHGHTGWPANVLVSHPNEERIRAALAEGPYGRCVYHCDNDVVDHQIVNLEMEDGVTVSFTMCAFNQGGREIHVMGTMGEIVGDMNANTITVTVFGQKPETVDVRTLADDFSGHGGGDRRLVEDLLDLEEGRAGQALTSIETSMESHYMAMAAEYSRLRHGETVELEKFVNET